MSRFIGKVLGLALIASKLVHSQDDINHARGPMQRLQAMTGTASESHSLNEDPVTEEDAVKEEGIKMTPSFLHDLHANGAEPLDMLSKTLASPGFQAILANNEIQHRILEEMPLLGAFDGFKQIRGRSLNEEQTKEGFMTGVKNLMALAKDAMPKIKNPAFTADTLSKMASSSDPVMKDLFRKVAAGEEAAVMELQDQFSREQFAGLDPSVLRDVVSAHTYEKLLSMPEIMSVIDRDASLSQVFRQGALVGGEQVKTAMDVQG